MGPRGSQHRDRERAHEVATPISPTGPSCASVATGTYRHFPGQDFDCKRPVRDTVPQRGARSNPRFSLERAGFPSQDSAKRMRSNPAGIVSEAVLNTILSDRGSDLPSAPEDSREPPSALRNRNEVAPRLPVGVVGPGTIYTQRLGRAEPAVSLAPLAIIARTATTRVPRSARHRQQFPITVRSGSG